MIILDICAVALVIAAAGIYWEVRAVARNARVLHKIQGLDRF